ncbi:MAG: hypothetical protein Q9183_006046 [Haloplaca sp. 2 TL-2023]
MTSRAANLSTLSATPDPTERPLKLTHRDNGYELHDPSSSDASDAIYASASSQSPPFRYHASLHPLDTDSTAPQAHPTIVSPQPPTPLSAGLRLQTHHLDIHSNLKTTNESSPQRAQPPGNIEIPIYEASASTNPLARSSSLRSALSATRSRANSLSPGSAFPSPGVGPLVDMTPLPSPFAVLDRPPSWGSSFEQTDAPATTTEVLGTAEERADEEQIPDMRSSPKKRRIPLRIDPEVMKINAASHARNRSLSDYVPEGMPVPRNRNVAVSGSIAPLSAIPRSPLEQTMHREEYLAVQRGIALPIPKPPTPPRSDQGSDEKTEAENRSLSPSVQAESLPLSYSAQMLRTGETRSWRAVRQLGQGTFSTVMLATNQNLFTFSPNHQTLTDEVQLEPKSLVAVKICDHGPAGGADEQKVKVSLKRELEILKTLHHPSLVHLKAVSEDDQRALLILNYCPGGDLFELAQLKHALLIPSLIRRIFAELVAAVRYLHSRYIVHRDIKLESESL